MFLSLCLMGREVNIYWGLVVVDDYLNREFWCNKDYSLILNCL